MNKNFRPKPFYFINTADPAALTPEACRESMERLAAQGFGGCVLFNKPPVGFTPELFLSDRWFDAIENFVVAGRELGLEMWLNDGFNYPPGDAAGRIEEANPTLRQKRLELQDDNQVKVLDVPWGFPAFELPESSELFIKFTYETMLPRLGKYFGNGLYGIFSDCDNRRYMPHSHKDLNSKPYFPWSDNFAEVFTARYGYDIVPELPGVLSGTAPEKARDYWETAGSLYIQWFANNHKWCSEHNLKYTFHSSDTGPLGFAKCPRTSLYSEGDPLELLSKADFPGTDHELAMLDGGTHFDSRYKVPVKVWGTTGRALNDDFNNTFYDVRAKYTQSSAFMLKKSRCMCEMFAATNYGTDYQELRRIGMYQIMQGINFIVPHAVHHRFYGQIKYFAPPEFMYSAMRNGVREFNDQLAEACAIASQGKYMAEVAIIEPTDEVWKGNDQAGENLFKLCDILKNYACGYVVVTREYARKYRNDFAVVIDPAAWDGKLDLANIPGNEITFDGGKIAFMRRKLDDGSVLLLAANIWSDEELTGTLKFAGQSYSVALMPGEYAVFGKNILRYRSPENRPVVLALPEKARTTYSDCQRIPLEAPKDQAAAGVVFNWRNDGEVAPLALEVAADYCGKIILDGNEISGGIAAWHWHESVRRIELPAGASAAGKHTLVLDGEFDLNNIPYMLGDVDVKCLLRDPAPGTVVRRIYNLTVAMPKEFELVLSPRSGELKTAIATGDQGALFYDGAITFHWEFELNEKASVIDLSGTSGVCDVKLDGVKQGRIINAPYTLPAVIEPGKHTLDVTLYGSEGALLEGGNCRVVLGNITLKK
ncbi:MAG: hypothetical protein E7051_08995 [Lentisphaerae bacterium]|nr:hypothetical protein [Lentisphaerota bacterium]